MEMIGIIGDGFVGVRQLCVDKQMMVAGVILINPGWRHAHIAESETDSCARGDARTIFEVYEIHSCVSR
jgi:hypothetical protein